MKIKDEYIGTKVSHKGKRSILDADRFEFYQSIGLGFMFEEPTVSEPKVIKYKAVKGPIPEPEVVDETITEEEDNGQD